MKAVTVSSEDEAPKNDMPAPRRRVPWALLAIAAIVIIAAAVYGLRWLTYERDRVITDDAYIDTDQVMVMSRISERVARVLVDQNVFVRKGQTLVTLDDAPERARLALAESNRDQFAASAQEAQHNAALEAELQGAQVFGNAARVAAARNGVDVAQAQEAAAREAITLARGDLLAARSAARSADAAVISAAAALRKAQHDAVRAQQLARDGFVATSAVDTAMSALAQARADDAAAKERAASAHIAVEGAAVKIAQQAAFTANAHAGSSAARSQIAVAQGSLRESAVGSRVPSKAAAAQAAVAAAAAMAAQVRLAELDLDATRMTAPVDGWVAQRAVEPGQTVAPGQALITISPEHRIFVTANYKETQLARIHPGQRVEITVDACHGTQVAGNVIGLAPVAQSALSTLPTLTAPSNFVKVAQRVPVRISLPKNNQRCTFRPGMSVETAVLSGT